jgi:histidine phosphotransferase ChpT
MHKNIALTQAMNARLCHDLANSIGTIDNCLNLAEHENKAIGKKAKNLALEESSNLVTKIKFFRGAYGISDEENSLSLIFLSKLITDFLKMHQIKLNFHFEKGVIYMEAPLAKALLGITILICENINNSGAIHFYITNDKNNPVKLVGKNKTILTKEDSIKVLTGELKLPVTVKNCRQQYINAILTKAGYQITVDKNSDSIEYNLIKIS